MCQIIWQIHNLAFSLDALILATAVELRAREILTFDERWRSLDPRVRVLTP
jgi:predicted nucleic acid-binding protein